MPAYFIVVNMEQNAGNFKAAIFSMSLFQKISSLSKSITDSIFQSRWFCRRQGNKRCARKKPTNTKETSSLGERLFLQTDLFFTGQVYTVPCAALCTTASLGKL
uniref:Uncharacterized protein n=1 Tax=Micrurus spixii TaxID=129469 RepID=A0A2D4MKB8_9SAUR